MLDNAPIQVAPADKSGLISSAWSTWFVKLVSIVRKNELQTLPVYADNAAATAAKLAVGTVYRTNVGVVMVVY